MDKELRHLAEEFLSTGYDYLNDRERKVISHIARRHHVGKRRLEAALWEQGPAC